mmetsp:Transcript_66987/g.160487  ORF Transcript_66987/g.160487 Transcript_66987/m.160487 type:complete len:227 (-) Transcript_66987:50-730(-)
MVSQCEEGLCRHMEGQVRNHGERAPANLSKLRVIHKQYVRAYHCCAWNLLLKDLQSAAVQLNAKHLWESRLQLRGQSACATSKLQHSLTFGVLRILLDTCNNLLHVVGVRDETHGKAFLWGEEGHWQSLGLWLFEPRERLHSLIFTIIVSGQRTLLAFLSSTECHPSLRRSRTRRGGWTVGVETNSGNLRYSQKSTQHDQAAQPSPCCWPRATRSAPRVQLVRHEK